MKENNIIELKMKNNNNKFKKDLHIFVDKELDTKFKEVIRNYKAVGFDKTNKSEITRMLITNFINEYNSVNDASYALLKELTNFRRLNNGGVIYE